jgi:hypothetical protein
MPSSMGAMSRSATGVGTIPSADRTNSASLKRSRMRLSALLTADCVMPRRSPASVTLRVA